MNVEQVRQKRKDDFKQGYESGIHQKNYSSSMVSDDWVRGHREGCKKIQQSQMEP